MIYKIITYLTCNLFIHSFIYAQPDLKFHPFDWVQYRKTGKINSISFSDDNKKIEIEVDPISIL